MSRIRELHIKGSATSYAMRVAVSEHMEHFLDKISSYNLFNYLLPGIVFSVVTNFLTNIQFIQSDLIIGLFVYYFLGLVISRVGSLVLEPMLKKFGVIDFARYDDYVKALEKDETLATFSEANNTYRTLASLCLFIPAAVAYDQLAQYYCEFKLFAPYVLLALLFGLFIGSYRKQTRYVKERAKAVLK